MLKKTNLRDAFEQFDDFWNPRVVAELNGQQVKVAKLKGPFDWHHHANEDELFMVFQGRLEMQWKQGDQVNTVMLDPGELFLIPKGVEHRPVAHPIAEVILFEPASTLNTGNLDNERTRRELEKL